MKSLLSAIAGAAALLAAPAAFATPIMFTAGTGEVIDGAATDVLGGGSFVNVNVQDISNGAGDSFSFGGAFENATVNDAAAAAFTVIAFEPTSLGSIANLVITFFAGEMNEQSFMITDGSGAAINPVGSDVLFSLDLAGAGDLIDFVVTGDARPSIAGIDPGLQFQITEVPIPAALPLLLSGIAGLGFASRRRKQAA